MGGTGKYHLFPPHPFFQGKSPGDEVGSSADGYNLIPRVRVALSSGTGNGDLSDNPFQLEFSLVDHLSMSCRTRSQKININGGKDSLQRVVKLLLSMVNQIFCSWTPIGKALKGGKVCCLNASDIGFTNKVRKITLYLNQIRLRKQTFACKGVLDKDCPVYVIVRFVN